MAEPITAIRIDPRDDVAVVLVALAAGDSVLGVTALGPIPTGHKIALRNIAAGEPIHKYGWPIGRATTVIACGTHVHTHNLATALVGEEAYRYVPAPTFAAQASDRSFQGYRRADGRVGTRNEIWILPTVGCVARTADRIARIANERFAGVVDGVHAFTHPHGCSQLGDDLGRTRALLAALAGHPNAGGVLLLGLGCESNQLSALRAAAPDLDPARVRWFAAQAEDDETEAGLAAVAELVAVASADRREPCPLSGLVVGLKCGGSDGLSGLTANPLVGRIANAVTGAGGSAILTEIPEIFGAERPLLDRAVDTQVFDAGVTLVNGFKRHFLDHGQPVSENPSPGNLDGGITTLEEKSLGAVQKGGHAPLTAVLRYGERVARPGLALLEAPGNDAVSSTALAAAGATIILFTTGRGTPLGFPVPTLKISTNSDLAVRKAHWIDFDAGRMLGELTPESATEELLDLIIATASGAPARNEVNGEREIAIWKSGVTL